MIIEKIGLSKELGQYFAIFEIVEHGFERKLQLNEYPHNLYIQNIQNTSAASTCLIVKKWFFSLDSELSLSSNDLLQTFFFYQVCNLAAQIEGPINNLSLSHRQLKMSIKVRLKRETNFTNSKLYRTYLKNPRFALFIL